MDHQLACPQHIIRIVFLVYAKASLIHECY